MLLFLASACSFAFFDVETNRETEQRAGTEKRLRLGLASRHLHPGGGADGAHSRLHPRPGGGRQGLPRDIIIALDDFGTGCSSLNVLHQLPLDVIKIDRSFVSPISRSQQARDFLGRIIDIVRSLELVSAAEGVETDQEMRLLAARQCDIVQGFLFSPALPTAALLRFLEARQRSALSA